MNPPSSKQHENGHHPRRVLYIEDDFSNRQLVKFLFDTLNNFELLEANTGEQGLQCATTELPDIILLDLSLPDISGYEVLKHLQQTPITSTTPVIAISGNNLPEDIEAGKNAGFHGYLTKPIIVAEMIQVLENALQGLK